MLTETPAESKPRPGPLPLISPMEAARRLGLMGDKMVADPHKCVLRMARRGELVAVHVGRTVRIRPESVATFIADQTGVPTDPSANEPLCLLAPLEAARRLGFRNEDTQRAVLTMAKRRVLEAVHVGRVTRIDPRSVDGFLNGEIWESAWRRRWRGTSVRALSELLPRTLEPMPDGDTEVE